MIDWLIDDVLFCWIIFYLFFFSDKISSSLLPDLERPKIGFTTNFSAGFHVVSVGLEQTYRGFIRPIWRHGVSVSISLFSVSGNLFRIIHTNKDVELSFFLCFFRVRILAMSILITLHRNNFPLCNEKFLSSTVSQISLRSQTSLSTFFRFSYVFCVGFYQFWLVCVAGTDRSTSECARRKFWPRWSTTRRRCKRPRVIPITWWLI